jgi:hypothetical protein
MDANRLCLSIASTTVALSIPALLGVKARLFGDGMADPIECLGTVCQTSGCGRAPLDDAAPEHNSRPTAQAEEVATAPW